MRELPKDEWRVEPCCEGHIAVSTHEDRGYRYWRRIAASDPPDDLVGRDDLKGVLVDEVDVVSGR
jgi:hypothetical protein